MSHELRTPLNAIAGYVELLEMGLRGPITDEQRSDLERIRLSQHHLLGLINDVLNFAKVDAGRIEYDLNPMQLDLVLKDCEAMVLPQIHRKRISYTYEECGLPVWVAADRDKVQQILLNLLSNAIKFTNEGGSLSASCDQAETTGRVHITDSGIGIEADKLEAVFEPFVQIDRSLNHPGQGAGLGLAISRSLARGMGGDIVVKSEPGVGSTFTLILPMPNKTEPDEEVSTSPTS
jgi:signal transduction histidine kinase